MWHDIPTIKSFIKQLIEMELIRKRNIEGYIYSYPILELTKAGKKVLAEKIKVELQIIKEQKPVKVGESEMATFELFSGGKNIEEIAKEIESQISCPNGGECCALLHPIFQKDNIDKFIQNAEICSIVFNVLENSKEEFLEAIFDFENPDL